MRRHPFLSRVVPRLGELADEIIAVELPARGSPRKPAASSSRSPADPTPRPCSWRPTPGERRPVAPLPPRTSITSCAAPTRRPTRTSAGTSARDWTSRCTSRKTDPRPLAARRGRGLEEAARLARRTFFDELLAADPCLACVATGHHRDDQVETVLLRLLRGCGLDGLRGIAPRRGHVIHPLLAETRASILAFLADVNQPWRLDLTNATGDAARNRLRRELLPALREIFGAGALDGLPRLADLAAADLDLLDHVTAAALSGAALPDGGLSVSRVRALHPALARRVLRRWLAEAAGLREDLAAAHVEAVRDWLSRGQSGQGLDLPHGVRLQRDFDHLRTRAAASPATIPCGLAAEFRISVVPLADESCLPGHTADRHRWRAAGLPRRGAAGQPAGRQLAGRRRHGTAGPRRA